MYFRFLHAARRVVGYVRHYVIRILQTKKSKKTAPNETKPSCSKLDGGPLQNSASSADSAVISMLKWIQADQSALLARVTDMESKFSEYDAFFAESEHFYEEEDYEPFCKGPRMSGDYDTSGGDDEIPSTSRFQKHVNTYKTEEVVSEEVDVVLAKLFTKGLPETVSENLTDDEKCSWPKNCDGLRPVKLNKLIWDVVSAKADNNDKKLQNVEKFLIKVGIHLTMTMVSLSKMEKECSEDLDFSNVLNSCEDALARLRQANVDIKREEIFSVQSLSQSMHVCAAFLTHLRWNYLEMTFLKQPRNLRTAVKWETGYSLPKAKEIVAVHNIEAGTLAQDSPLMDRVILRKAFI